MASALKCPNPSCPYLFDPTTVPAGVVLACPRCGMRFTLGPPAPPPPAPAPSPAEAAATVTFQGPPASAFPGSPPGFPAPPTGYRPPQPPAPAPPAESDFGEMTPETARADGQEGPRLPVRENRFQTPVLIGVAILSVACAGVAIWWKIQQRNNPPAQPSGGGGTVFKDLNLSFEAPPDPPWQRDEDMRAKLGSPYILVYRRSDPEAYIAFGAKDYDPRPPRESELRDGLVRPLERMLEPDTRKEYADEIDKTWMGQPVRGFRFGGTLKQGPQIEGDAVAVAYKGVAYWHLSWTPLGGYGEVQPAFAASRQRCKLLDLRQDWKPKQSTVVPFKNNVLGYTLLDPDGIWKEETSEERVRAEDPKADKLLTAKLKQKGRDFADEAELVVFVLDAGGDPLADARVYVESRANANVELFGRNTFSEVTGPLEGDPAGNALGGTAPHLLLKSINDRDPTHVWFYAVSAIRVGDKTVVACAKCKWLIRSVFDTRFVEFVKTLKAG